MQTLTIFFLVLTIILNLINGYLKLKNGNRGVAIINIIVANLFGVCIISMLVF